MAVTGIRLPQECKPVSRGEVAPGSWFIRPMKPRLVIADPHASIREMLAAALGGVAAVVGTAGRLEEAVRLAGERRAEVVLTSLGLPDMSGSAAVRRLREALPDTRVLVHTGTTDRALLLATLAAGPAGLAHRAEGLAALRGAVAAVGRGAGYFSPQVAGLPRGADAGQPGAPRGLSDREREVLGLVAAGLSSKAVAARLGVSPRTVENHRAHLQRKLGLRGAAELTRFALNVSAGPVGMMGTAF